MSLSQGFDECHCLALRRGARHVTRLYDGALAPSGLSISQFSLLSVIARRPRIRIVELCQIMVMERTTLLRGLKPLLAAGLIAADRAKGEQAFTYAITPEGIARREMAVPLWKGAQAALEQAFEPGRADVLRREALALMEAGFG